MKLRWRNIFICIGLMALMALMVVTAVYTESQRKKALCKKIYIEFAEDHNFVTKNSIETIVKQSIPNLVGCNLDTLSTAATVAKIEKLAWVKEAHIYKGYEHEKNVITSVLRVKVYQYKPKFRVQNHGNGYYISEEKKRLPLSSVYTPRLVVVTGNPSKEMVENELFDFIDYIENDKFWNAQIEQIHVSSKDIFLVPRVGSHIIEFGRICDVETKFRNMEIMYKQGFNSSNWNKYRTISLKYKGQVVCTLK